MIVLGDIIIKAVAHMFHSLATFYCEASAHNLDRIIRDCLTDDSSEDV